ncbi:MAG: phosphotransferase family protein [Pedobacter sp.]|nr:phosphotransferase family protein [Pedobacter sp.]
MSALPDSKALAELLTSALGPLQLSEIRRLSAGASAETWALEAITAKREIPLILRRAAGHERFSLANPKQLEAACQDAAGKNGVPVAQVFAVFNDEVLGEGYVMQRINGETLPPRILKEPTLAAAREKLTAQCGEILARLHATPLTNIPGLRLQDAQVQLDDLEKFYRMAGDPLPVFELVLRWLRENAPVTTTATLVHGDFRHGNFIVNENGIAAVLDWELSHSGDPMEDLGWLCVNAWRFGVVDKPVGGFGQREELFAAYEKAGGQKVNVQQVLYWELFGCFKWGVICLFQAWSHLSGNVPSLERAVIGRRVSETEIDMLVCLKALQEQKTS